MKTYEQIGNEIGKLVDRKQKEYGDSYGKSEAILKTLYPNGIRPEQYKNLLYIVRVNDKLCRISTDNDPSGENPAHDIGGYSLLHVAQNPKKTLFEKHKKLTKKEIQVTALRSDPDILKQVEDIVNGIDV
jgi:hypothetical protein